MQAHRQSLFVAILSMILGAGCMVAMSVFIKLAHTHTTINVILFFRYFLFLIAITPLAIAKKAHRCHSKNLRFHIYRGCCGLTAGTAYFTALNYLPIANANILFASAPLFVPVVLRVFQKIPIVKKLYWGMGIGLLGIVVILHPTTGIFHITAVIALTGALFRAVSAIFIRRLTKTDTPLTIMFHFFLIATFLTALSLPFTPHSFSDLPMHDLLGVGIFGGIYQLLLTYAYRHAPARLISPFSYFSVIFAMLADWVIWGQVPSFAMFLGIAIVIVGSILTIYARQSILAKP